MIITTATGTAHHVKDMGSFRGGQKWETLCHRTLSATNVQSVNVCKQCEKASVRARR